MPHLSQRTVPLIRASALLGVLALATLATAAETPWPAEVPGFVAPAAGEHPRLLFRKSDVPALRAKAATPEGKAIVARLRATLNGSDGESMTTDFNPQVTKPAQDGAGPYEKTAPLGAFSISHAAGYGMLYQLTGDKKYAEFGKECFEKALEGYRDRDNRYSLKAPFGALRTGPSIGWMVLGYDLCYDGWEPAYREKIAKVFAEYDEGRFMTLEEQVRGSRHKPGSNHWGMQVGGGALVVLAIMNDPGVDMAKIKPLLEVSQKSMIRNMTEGFGDGGFFAEGDGTGSMSSHIVFLAALQAWRVAGGKDFVSPRPNAKWMANKWFFLSLAKDGKATFQPQRGGYPHNIWARHDISGAGYFSYALGIAPDERHAAAVTWFYENFGFRAADEAKGTPFDTICPHPHISVLSLVNWPVGIKPINPGDVYPHAYRDTKWGFYAWRNRWQDFNDVVISILTKTSKGLMSAKGEDTLSILTGGKVQKWGKISGFSGSYSPAADGSTILTTGDGSCLVVDFSGASGVPVMLAMSGPGAPADGAIDAGGTRVSFLFLGGTKPTPKANGGAIIIGDQTVTVGDKGLLSLAKMAAPAP